MSFYFAFSLLYKLNMFLNEVGEKGSIPNRFKIYSKTMSRQYTTVQMY